MIRSMQSAIAGLKSHQTKMDVIGNNIANVNTWGYKSKSANFADAMYQNYITGAAGNAAAGFTGGINTSQIGYGANVSSITSNMETGTQSYTGRAFDCMINGPAFFIVGPYTTNVDTDDLDGAGLSLSRVGIFSMDSNGYLVDDKGNYVYGYTTGTVDPGTGNVTVDTAAGTELQPIRLNVAIDGTPAGNPITYSSVKIGSDGVITVVDKDSISHVVGQFALATVENVNGMEQDSGFTYEITENAGEINVGPQNDASGEVLSGYLEMSNVDLATEMSYMITTQRGYQANTRMITVSDQMLEELVNMKR
ncbi:MAG TPA: flagellar hook-basal body complex protein [Candidatus Mediterraneibacter merdavium]|nr:flagellar hook-basal body complex protein [Candidatus Mediterraneibacter merdavium]